MERAPDYWIFTGPESTGKTSLASGLSAYSGLPYVEEQARVLMEAGHYSEVGPFEILALAECQFAAEELWAARRGLPLILDTDLLTFVVWHEWTFGPAPAWWSNRILSRQHVHYFLCRPDIIWQEDPLRQHPDDREALFHSHEKLLIQWALPFTIIEGVGPDRIERVREVFDNSRA